LKRTAAQLNKSDPVKNEREYEEMQLNSQQQDALSELINIGFGRAASALSVLVGQRVLIEAPDVSLYPIENLNSILSTLSIGEITSVHQVFSGRISGTAMLLMDVNSSTALADLLAGGSGTPHEVSDADREAMQETGNILLNAFTGSFGNLLQVHISFTVPHVYYDSLNNMLNTLMIDQQELEYALVVRVNFQLSNGQVSGYVVIIMGVQSMEKLLESMRAAGFIE
jgi:chemotaxis protein CheC